MARRISMMNPKNAAVGWSQACTFWRFYEATCPNLMALGFHGVPGSGNAISVAFSGAWFSGVVQGSVRSNCANTDPYVSSSGDAGAISGPMAFVYIDVWKALADGLWSSSTVIDILIKCTYASNVDIHVGLSITIADVTNPLRQSVSIATPPTGIGAAPFNAGCASATAATLTVYDDGTFTLT